MRIPARYLVVTSGALAVIAIVAARCRMGADDERRHREHRAEQRAADHNARRLDVAAFRADLARRKAKIDALRAQDTARERPPYEPPPASSLVRLLVDPQCAIGPGELCKALEDVIVACDGGDGTSCYAVAQYLQDTPPRPRVGAMTFLIQGCKRGEQAACERLDQLKQPFAGTCATDPMACAVHAMHVQDYYLLGQACEAGVADTCQWLATNIGNPTARRHYLTTSCQLGDPAACTELGRRLSPGCDGDDCYPPDPEQAASALAIGCAAGVAAACK